MNNEKQFFDFKKWSAKNYMTATELENYIKSIEDKIISKPLNKIMSMGIIFNDDREYFEPNKTEDVALMLDEPVILFFGDEQFEILYWEESYAQIALNTLNQNIRCDMGPDEWLDISKYYSKNIIGRKLKKIIIEKTDKPSISFYRPPVEGKDDAYDEIIFEFENGAKFGIGVCCADYMGLYEV